MTKLEAKRWLLQYLTAATCAASLRRRAYEALNRGDTEAFYAIMLQANGCETASIQVALRQVARYFDEP
jgi:predicted transcriptional regulator